VFFGKIPHLFEEEILEEEEEDEDALGAFEEINNSIIIINDIDVVPI